MDELIQNEKLKLSESQEDYLKHIFLFEEFDKTVSTQALSEKMKVRPASVTGMLKKLAELKLVRHEPYHGVALTEAGRKIALEIVRHHRLLELYLTEALGYTWDEVHEEADRLEHVISEDFESRIAEFLGHPTHDPHGDPIPTAELVLPPSDELVCLTELGQNQKGVIRRVRTQDKDQLNLMSHLNLVLESEVLVLGIDKGEIRIEVDNERFLIPPSIASHVWLTVL